MAAPATPSGGEVQWGCPEGSVHLRGGLGEGLGPFGVRRRVQPVCSVAPYRHSGAFQDTSVWNPNAI